MEKDKEIAKLVRVLSRIANPSGFAMWRETESDCIDFSRQQFNRVLARLTELDPEASGLFAPLGNDASITVVRMAAGDLAAYFVEGTEPVSEHRRHDRCRPRHAFVGAVHVGGRC